MKQIVIFLTKVFVFFEAYFLLGRLFFLIYNYDKIRHNSFFEILLSNYYSLPLDISTLGYFITAILLFIIAGVWFKQAFFRKAINVLIIILIITCSLINIADTGLVSTWGTKVNAKALSYVFYPELMTQAVLSVNYFVLSAWLVIYLFVSVFIFIKYIRFKARYEVSNKLAILFLPLLFIAFTCIRGGWGNNPIGKSRGVYCDNPTLNLATVNGFWNFMALYVKKQHQDSYDFFALPVAEEILKKSLSSKKDTTISVLNTTRPNIVVILLESFSAENMRSLGGTESNAPCLDSLSQDGLLFTDFYATGNRTEQGFVALLSGFPAQPKFSVQRESGKVFKLPMLSKILRNNGYELNFYYTGDLEYARTDEYLRIGLFNRLHGRDDFRNVPRNNSGAYDEYLFKFQLEKADECKSPFFSLLLTSSTHEPFDGKFNEIFKAENPESRYKNAVHYSDSCLSAYLNEARSKNWYHNTLFVILADHANSFPNKREFIEPLRFKIPMLFFGDVLRNEFKGTVSETPACQVDIPSTLLAQLNIRNSDFEFSKNLFNPYITGYAFYTFDNGFGIIDKSNAIVFDNDKMTVMSRFSKINAGDSVTLNRGKAILQVLMQRFIEME